MNFSSCWRKIGITGFNSATHYASIILARHLGVDLKDFTLIPAGLDTELTPRARR